MRDKPLLKWFQKSLFACSLEWLQHHQRRNNEDDDLLRVMRQSVYFVIQRGAQFRRDVSFGESSLQDGFHFPVVRNKDGKYGRKHDDQ